MQFTLLQVVAIALILVAVLLIAQAWIRRHPNAPIVREVDAAEKKIEQYTDAEITRLAASLVARLTDTAAEAQAKADADAAIVRKAQLLGKIQTIVANARAV